MYFKNVDGLSSVYIYLSFSSKWHTVQSGETGIIAFLVKENEVGKNYWFYI